MDEPISTAPGAGFPFSFCGCKREWLFVEVTFQGKILWACRGQLLAVFPMGTDAMTMHQRFSIVLIIAAMALSLSCAAPLHGAKEAGKTKAASGGAMVAAGGGPAAPCWVEDNSCQAKPGRLYFVGRAKGSSAGPVAPEMVAETVALSQLAAALSTEVFSSSTFVSLCSKRNLEQANCERDFKNKIVLKARAAIGPRDFRVVKKARLGEFLHLRIAIPQKKFHKLLSGILRFVDKEL